MILQKKISVYGGEYKISPHFKLKEFASPGTDLVKYDTVILRMLERIRAYFGGGGIYITSGYRAPTHNTNVGGASNSAHLYGQAVDFVVYDGEKDIVPSQNVCIYLQDIGWSGSIGFINRATHIDTRYKNLMDETKTPYYFMNIDKPGKNFRQYFHKPMYKVQVMKGSNIRTGAGITFRKKDYADKCDYYFVYAEKKSAVLTTWIKIGTYRWIYKGNCRRV